MNTLTGQTNTYTNHNSGSRRKKNSLKHQQQVNSTLYQIPEYFEEPVKNDNRENSIESLIRGNTNYITTTNNTLTPCNSGNGLTPTNSANTLTPLNSNNTIISAGSGANHNLDNDSKLLVNNPSRNKYASKLLSNRNVSTASLYQNIMAKRNSNVTIRSGSNGHIIVSDNNGTASSNPMANGDTEGLGNTYNNGINHKDNRGSANSLNRGSNSSSNSTSSTNSIIYDRLQQGINPMTHLELKRINSIRPSSATILTKPNTITIENMKNGAVNNKKNGIFNEKFHSNNDINPRDLYFKRSKSEQTLKNKDFGSSREKLCIDEYTNGKKNSEFETDQHIFRSNFVLGGKTKSHSTESHLDKLGNLNKNTSSDGKFNNECDETEDKNEDHENISVSSSNQSPLNTTTLTSAVLSRNSSRRNSSNLSTNLFTNTSVPKENTQSSNNKTSLFQKQPITRAQLKMDAMKSKFDMFNSLDIPITSSIESISDELNKNKNTNAIKNKSMSASTRAKTLENNESTSTVPTSVLDYIGSASAKQHQPAFPSSLSRKVSFTSSNDSSLNDKAQLDKGFDSHLNDLQTELHTKNKKYWMVNNDLETRLLNEKINRQLDTIQRRSQTHGSKLLHKHVEHCYKTTIKNELYMQKLDQVISAQTSSIEVPKYLNPTIDTITSTDNIVSDEIQSNVVDAHDLLNFQQKLHSLKNGSSTGDGASDNYDLSAIKNSNLRKLITEGLGKIEDIWYTAESSFL